MFSYLIRHLHHINYLHLKEYGFRKHFFCVTQSFQSLTNVCHITHSSSTTNVILIYLPYKNFRYRSELILALKSIAPYLIQCAIDWTAALFFDGDHAVTSHKGDVPH